MSHTRPPANEGRLVVETTLVDIALHLDPSDTAPSVHGSIMAEECYVGVMEMLRAD